VKVGLVGPKTGPLAAGAAVTHFPPFKLWAHEVNARGGFKLKSGQAKIELIEYDDRTQPPETIKAVERLATVDKADWIGGVFATGFNLATAPVGSMDREAIAAHFRGRAHERCGDRGGSGVFQKFAPSHDFLPGVLILELTSMFVGTR
jgi:hypothetical protein